jgi:hypothetical protein
MKKILTVLILVLITFPGCKFINERILGKGSDTLDVYVANLERELAGIESEHFYELEKMKMESQAKIDSVINYYESQFFGKGRKYTGGTAGTYYIITGSFKTPKYADAWSAKVTGMGYRSEVVQMGYWNLVASGYYKSLREAINNLDNMRSAVTPDSWIYVSR